MAAAHGQAVRCLCEVVCAGQAVQTTGDQLEGAAGLRRD
jgi:hypothetical protein